MVFYYLLKTIKRAGLILDTKLSVLIKCFKIGLNKLWFFKLLMY